MHETVGPGDYFAGRILLNNSISLKYFLKDHPNNEPIENIKDSQLTIVLYITKYRSLIHLMYFS